MKQLKVGKKLQWMVTITVQVYAAPQKNSLVHKEKIHLLQGRILQFLKSQETLTYTEYDSDEFRD